MLQHEARSVEINPLLITPDGRVIAADCRITIDDYAVNRTPTGSSTTAEASLASADHQAFPFAWAAATPVRRSASAAPGGGIFDDNRGRRSPILRRQPSPSRVYRSGGYLSNRG